MALSHPNFNNNFFNYNIHLFLFLFFFLTVHLNQGPNKIHPFPLLEVYLMNKPASHSPGSAECILLVLFPMFLCFLFPVMCLLNPETWLDSGSSFWQE